MALKTRIIIAKRTLEKLYQNTFEPLVHNTLQHTSTTYIHTLFYSPLHTYLLVPPSKKAALAMDWWLSMHWKNQRTKEWTTSFLEVQFSNTSDPSILLEQSGAHTKFPFDPIPSSPIYTAKRTPNKGTALCFIHTYTCILYIGPRSVD